MGIHLLWRYLHRVKPDILHAFNFHANLLAKLVVRFNLSPLSKLIGKQLDCSPIVIVSEASVEFAKSPVRVRWDRWTADWAEAHYVNAKAVREKLVEREQIPQDRVWLVPTGVDTKVFAPQDPDKDLRQEFGIKQSEKVVVSVARLAKYKGHDFLLKTLQLATRNGRPYRLILVGDGPQRGPLEEMAKKLGIADRVIFAGGRPSRLCPGVHEYGNHLPCDSHGRCHGGSLPRQDWVCRKA
jgi:glycosyltransferase involved in cell wall biosynthesis